MDILFNSTEAFEKDIQRFDSSVRKRIAYRINEVAQAFIKNRRTFAQIARKPYKIKLNNGFKSSLYSVKLDEPDIRIILTIEDDPIFDQGIVTLMRVVNRGNLREAYSASAMSLYQDFGGVTIG